MGLDISNMFNLFNRNKEQKEEKKEKVCYVCGCFYKNGKTTDIGFCLSGRKDTEEFCLGCAPKYDTKIYGYDRIQTKVFKNNVECDENGIPLIGVTSISTKTEPAENLKKVKRTLRRYTPEEDAKIISYSRGGIKPTQIAKELGRTAQAIQVRLFNMRKKGKV